MWPNVIFFQNIKNSKNNIETKNTTFPMTNIQTQQEITLNHHIHSFHLNLNECTLSKSNHRFNWPAKQLLEWPDEVFQCFSCVWASRASGLWRKNWASTSSWKFVLPMFCGEGNDGKTSTGHMRRYSTWPMTSWWSVARFMPLIWGEMMKWSHG